MRDFDDDCMKHDIGLHPCSTTLYSISLDVIITVKIN